jgi:hypothetical protein
MLFIRRIVMKLKLSESRCLRFTVTINIAVLLSVIHLLSVLLTILFVVSSVTYVTKAEWSALQQRFKVDIEIRRDLKIENGALYEVFTPG